MVRIWLECEWSLYWKKQLAGNSVMYYNSAYGSVNILMTNCIFLFSQPGVMTGADML